MSTGLQRIGRYELSKRLRSGKANEVWIASDPQSHSYVTIRMFYTTIQADSGAMREFRQNVERVASLRHPDIVRIHDVLVFPSGNPDGPAASMVCIVMDYVEGPTLADYVHYAVSGGKIRPGAAIVHLFTSLSLVIDYAHQQGIIHGNLNPGSILLRRNATSPGQIGEPVLTDFDYTRVLRDPGGMTSSFYLSPEQIRGHAATERSDIYSLGVILYELCTGVLPFRGNRPIAIMMQHLNALPTPPEVMNPTISSPLSNVILRSLAKEPGQRFPSASSLTIALAHALNIPAPEELRHAAYVAEESYSHGLHPRLQAGATPFLESTTYRENGGTTRTYPAGSRTGIALPLADQLRSRRRRSRNVWYLISIFALVLATLGTMATLLLLPRHTTSTPNQLVGHAFFLSSGQFNANSPQGINDEVQVVLSGIPDPPAGKSYYAWLLADQNVSESLPLSLGPLHIDHGKGLLLYSGDQQHTNLLGVTSRFLITVDDAHHPLNNPLIDMSSWRYNAAIPLVPSPVDKLHFSMLDHLRHLLVESPELNIRGLHGGLAFWLVRNAATVSALANSTRDTWRNKDAATIHHQVIQLLDYLDGKAFALADLPPGTPLLADAHTSQVALLGPAPHNPDAPGYAYDGEAPPGYVYLISEHMTGAIQSPQTTRDQRTLAVQINRRLDAVIHLFEQVQYDAKHLLLMNNAQLLQPPALALLNDLAIQAQYAYAGQLDPSTGQPGGGALWIYNNLQRLAAFEIRPYVASV
ncbi:MAG: serine/threonine protein kinase [Ktedonobacteraceae bacterium]|nr:serine/threonine protein kinase [Ktedonobacteraceae bacterium]